MTTSTNLDSITESLAKLHGYTYFRPQAGPLMARLSRAVLDQAEDELRGTLSHAQFAIEVSIGPQEGKNDYAVIAKVDHPGVSFSCQIDLSELTDAELADLARYLVEPTVEQPAAVETSHRAVLKRAGGSSEDDHHEKGPASARLKVSPEWLKSVIPCTDYSYEEIEGKKYIREYFWSKELIERLFKIKCSKTTPEDLQYVAKECCEGDLEWAKDLIARLKSPNRPEPAPKEQSKVHGKTPPHMPQVKIAPPRPPHGKFAPARPAPGTASGSGGQERAAGKPAGDPASQAKGGSGKGAPAGGEAGGTAPGGGQRERSRRSRNRKFRQQRKDGAGKPDPAGDKQPPK